MALALEQGVQLGDVITAEEASEHVTRESRLLSNATGDPMTLVCGYPMNITSDTAVAALAAAGIANCDALLLMNLTLEDGESMLVPLLARGPAAYNKDKLPLLDYAGATINQANFQAALLANIPLLAKRAESPTQQTQET